MTVTTEQLADFCAAIDAKRQAHFVRMAHFDEMRLAPTIAEVGRTYARIMVSENSIRSVFCFVRLDDGSILKAASLYKPANGVRGNIANGAADVGPSGAVYLRQAR